MKAQLSVIFGLIMYSSWANGAVEISSDRELARVSAIRNEFESAIDLHRRRKVGVGFAGGGAVGTASVFAQMHFALDVGVFVGYGFGRGFNSFNFGFRKLVSAGSVVPYWGVAYARWADQGDPIDNGDSSILRDRFLSGTEQATGNFS